MVPEPPLLFCSHRAILISISKGSMADLASSLFGHRLGPFCEAEPWARSTERGRRCMPGATGTRATGRTTRRWTPPCGYPSCFCHWKRRGSIPRKSADDAPCDVTTCAVCVVISILIPHPTSGVSRNNTSRSSIIPKHISTLGPRRTATAPSPTSPVPHTQASHPVPLPLPGS